MKTKVCAHAFAMLCLAIIQPVVAQVEGLPWERGNLSIGAFFTDLDTEVRLDSAAGLGTVIDVENLLGIKDESNVFRVDAFYRIRPKHRVDFMYYDLSRDSSNQLSAEIKLPDQTIPIDTVVDSNFDIRFFKLGYSYSFLQDDRMDLGLSIGAYVADVDIGIKATDTEKKTEEDFTAPLPVIGLRGDFAITPKLFYKNSAEFFYLKIGDYRGSIVDLNMKVEYNLFKHLGLGLGYNFLRINVENDGGSDALADLTGSIELDYSGLQAYGKFYF